MGAINLEERGEKIGADIYKQQAPQDVRLKVNPCRLGITNTITRAELTAIFVTL
jgi:ribonuclease HI